MWPAENFSTSNFIASSDIYFFEFSYDKNNQRNIKYCQKYFDINCLLYVKRSVVIRAMG